MEAVQVVTVHEDLQRTKNSETVSIGHMMQEGLLFLQIQILFYVDHNLKKKMASNRIILHLHRKLTIIIMIKFNLPQQQFITIKENNLFVSIMDL